MKVRLRPALPVAAAALLAWLGGLGPVGTSALIGAGLWLALLLAGHRPPLQFAALALFGGVLFGFMAAAVAALHGLSVQQLLASPLSRQPVGIVLGWIAVALAALGVCSATMAMLAPPPAEDAGNETGNTGER